MSGIIRKRFTKQKAFILFVSTVFAANLFFAANFYLSRDLTDEERKETVDFQQETGLHKAKIYFNSLAFAGAGFCGMAVLLLIISKRAQRKK